MGYTLSIGELAVDYDNDSDCPSINLGAEREKHPEAPAFGEPTDSTNERWPSCTVWADFATRSGLYGLFFPGHNRDDSLITQHPGCVPLTKRHVEDIDKALHIYKCIYPDIKADFETSEGGVLCRLIWLQYWTTWAVDKCEKPVFVNS